MCSRMDIEPNCERIRAIIRGSAESCSVSENSGTLAQLVEQRTFNPFVVGSTPARPTTGTPVDIDKPAIVLIAGFFFFWTGDSLVTVSTLMGFCRKVEAFFCCSATEFMRIMQETCTVCTIRWHSIPRTSSPPRVFPMVASTTENLWVICPSCHREIHYRAKGHQRNAALTRHLVLIK